MKEKGKSIKVYLLGMLIVGIGMGLTTVIADTIINSTNVSYKTTTVKAALDDLYGLTADDIWQKIYPIGSIYTSVSPTSPATLFGGTWERFGNGKAIVGVDESDNDFKTVALTGGSKTKTIAVENLPAHTHSVAAINTGNQSANHTHTIAAFNTNSGGNSGTIQLYVAPRTLQCYGSATTNGKSTTSTYLSSAGSNTSSEAGTSCTFNFNHTHSVPAKNTGGISANHHHQVPAHNTNSTGSGTALNVQNPYITVYMWKRTA